jgi:trimeric autotransporter adhesin
MYKKIIVSTVSSLLAFAVIGCGGSSSNSNPIPTTQLRVVDLITAPTTASILVNNQSVNGTATFYYANQYQTYNAGSESIQFNNQANSAALISLNHTLAANTFTTIIGYNTSATTYATMVLDDTTGIHDSNVRFRLVNAAPLTGTVDVYVSVPGASIAAATPTQQGVTVGDTSQIYVMQAGGPGSYQVQVTSPGTKTVLASYTTPVALTAGQSETFVLGNDGNGVPQVVPQPIWTF